MTKRVVILASGKGTRVQPYTTVLPKPLMKPCSPIRLPDFFGLLISPRRFPVEWLKYIALLNAAEFDSRRNALKYLRLILPGVTPQDIPEAPR